MKDELVSANFVYVGSNKDLLVLTINIAGLVEYEDRFYFREQIEAMALGLTNAS